jgi:hypothetical protein
MRRFSVKLALAALAVAGVLAAVAAPAPAATPLERRVTALQRTVTAQQRRVRSLEAQVTQLRRQANTTARCPASAMTLPDVCQLALEGVFVAYCSAAITGDAFQTTWQVINQVGNRSVLFQPIQPLNDEEVCGRALRVTRQASVVPPTIAPFQQILARLTGRPLWLWQPLWLRQL